MNSRLVTALALRLACRMSQKLTVDFKILVLQKKFKNEIYSVKREESETPSC
jgi:hypothetical protein